jgi:hypothetical protein
MPSKKPIKRSRTAKTKSSNFFGKNKKLLLAVFVGVIALVGVYVVYRSFAGTNRPQTFSSGTLHNCAIVTGGKVKCWGDNFLGQLGNGTTKKSSIPVEVKNISGATAIAAGGSHSCAVVAGGKVQCWGNNHYGTLGNQPPNPYSNAGVTIPVGVKDISGATQISLGDFHSCAVVGGGVRCWGWDILGQLGNGSNIDYSTVPVIVQGVTVKQ